LKIKSKRANSLVNIISNQISAKLSNKVGKVFANVASTFVAAFRLPEFAPAVA